MDLFAPKHLLLILMIVLLVFGGKKLKTLGSDLGSAFRGFKKSVSEADATESSQPHASAIQELASNVEAPLIKSKPFM